MQKKSDDNGEQGVKETIKNEANLTQNEVVAIHRNFIIILIIFHIRA